MGTQVMEKGSLAPPTLKMVEP